MAEKKTNSSTAIDPTLPEKKRGRRRLIGAVALLMGAGVILSIVFDHEPKPATPELALKIPAKDKSAAPTPTNEASSLPSGAASDAKSNAAGPDASKAETTKLEQPKVDSASAQPSKDTAPAADTPKAEPPKAEPAKAEPAKAEPAKAEPAKVDPPKAAAKVEPKVVDEKKAKAVAPADPIAELAKQTSTEGFMVQIGAFSSTEKMQAAVETAREAGYKVTTEKVKTTNGERTRVRVGPFKTREAANKARDKLKAQGLDPALIAL